MRFLLNSNKASINKKFVKDSLWIGGGQIVSLFGSLFGLRLLTEALQPSVFGELSLVLATLALAQGLLYYPFGQAIFRYYTNWTSAGWQSLLQNTAIREYGSRYIFCAVFAFLVFLVADIFYQIHVSWTTLLLGLMLLGLDGWKTLETVMTSSARNQLAYSALITADSTIRPLAAALAAWVWEPTIEAVLFAQCVGAMVVLVLYRVIAQSAATYQSGAQAIDSGALVDSMRQYARPLLWVPFIGWVSGLADRFTIGVLLGVADVGIYAAAYGIASRPFLMLASVTESTFRQPYYSAVSSGDVIEARRILRVWQVLNIFIGISGVAAFMVLGELFVSILLAKEYSVALVYLPWIALGYALLILAQPFERKGYAIGLTGAVTWVQMIGAILSLALGALGAWLFGLLGAAIAVPGYFGIQLLLTWYIVRGTELTRRQDP